MGTVSRFVQELQRRHVIRATVAYIVSAWLVVQVAGVLLPVFDAPEIVMQPLPRRPLFLVLPIPPSLELPSR